MTPPIEQPLTTLRPGRGTELLADRRGEAPAGILPPPEGLVLTSSTDLAVEGTGLYRSEIVRPDAQPLVIGVVLRNDRDARGLLTIAPPRFRASRDWTRP